MYINSIKFTKQTEGAFSSTYAQLTRDHYWWSFDILATKHTYMIMVVVRLTDEYQSYNNKQDRRWNLCRRESIHWMISNFMLCFLLFRSIETYEQFYLWIASIQVKSTEWLQSFVYRAIIEWKEPKTLKHVSLVLCHDHSLIIFRLTRWPSAIS